MYFSYEHLQMRYEPFPIGIARPLMEESLYREFVDNYPEIERFASHAAYGKAGVKYALTEKLDSRQYYRFIKSNPLWRDFYRWVTRGDFVKEALMALFDRDIDLGYAFKGPRHRLGQIFKDLKNGRLCPRQLPLMARFEFSALPANGGMVVPHTDATRKLVTFVVSMVREGEWDPSYGGGVDLSRPRDSRRSFNQENRHAEFDDMEVIDTVEFRPNQAVVFVKTFNSWHSVRPMTGAGSEALRRTLTINIMLR